LIINSSGAGRHVPAALVCRPAAARAGGSSRVVSVHSHACKMSTAEAARTGGPELS